jgi:integrase
MALSNFSTSSHEAVNKPHDASEEPSIAALIKFATQRTGIESNSYRSLWNKGEILRDGARAFIDEADIARDVGKLAECDSKAEALGPLTEYLHSKGRVTKPQALIRQAATEIAIQTVLDGLDSGHSRRAYERHLRRFISWHQATGSTVFNKAVVQRYAAELRESGLSAATVNQRLSAIRRLALEAADYGAVDSQIANGIRAIKGMRQEGTRTGNWLTREQAQAMLSEPDPRTLKGLRDRAILGLLIGCGLRRTEAAGVTFGHIQQRDGRWVLVDIMGKRNKIRSVPMPNWTKQAIDQYASVAGLGEGIVFRPVNKGGRIGSQRMSEQAIYNLSWTICRRFGPRKDCTARSPQNFC